MTKKMGVVFVGGPPKSGTTMLQGLLDSHPELLVLPEESNLARYIAGGWWVHFRHPPDISRALTYRGFSAFREPSSDGPYRDLDWQILSKRAEEIWEASPKKASDVLESFVLGYGDATRQTGKKSWVEKTPMNDRYALRLARYWPNKRLVSMLRDPRDNFLSYASHRAKMGRAVHTPAAFVSMWSETVAGFIHYRRATERAHLIKYEELVSAPKETMERVAVAIGISFHESLLRPSKAGVSWGGNSVQHDAPVYEISDRSVGVHRTGLDDDLHDALVSVFDFAVGRLGWWEPTGDVPDSLPAAISGSDQERNAAWRNLRRLNKLVLNSPDGLRLN